MKYVLHTNQFKIKDTNYLIVGTHYGRNKSVEDAVDTVVNMTTKVRKDYKRKELVEMIEKYSGKFVY